MNTILRSLIIIISIMCINTQAFIIQNKTGRTITVDGLFKTKRGPRMSDIKKGDPTVGQLSAGEQITINQEDIHPLLDWHMSGIAISDKLGQVPDKDYEFYNISTVKTLIISVATNLETFIVYEQKASPSTEEIKEKATVTPTPLPTEETKRTAAVPPVAPVTAGAGSPRTLEERVTALELEVLNIKKELAHAR